MTATDPKAGSDEVAAATVGSAHAVPRWADGAAALLSGVLVALALPPWGLWPLAFVGLAIVSGLVVRTMSAKRRAFIGLVFAAGWFSIGCGWMWQLTAPGYVVVVAIFGGYLAAVFALVGHCPKGWRSIVAVPIAITVAEVVRFSFPFGGVPLASLPIGQAASPLSRIGRIGGPILLTFATALLGSVLAAAFRRNDRRPAVASAVVVVALTVLGFGLPHGRNTGPVRLALVQGGGPQGTRAINDDSDEVFARHERASAQVADDVDAVVWPENVISVGDGSFSQSELRFRVAALAAVQRVPYLVGVTDHPDRPDRFQNSQTVVNVDGTLADQYVKVRRVPFGEYIPLRGALKSIGIDPAEIPSDATAGTGPAFIDVPTVGRFAVVISWEVFFGGRARDGVRKGGTVLLNPTNGSSYTGTIVQTQQVASSRLRALETGRWVAQVSPTGFTAFVSPDGDVYDRTAQTEQALITRTISHRSGLTLYSRLGDRPFAVAAVLGLVVLRQRRRRSSAASTVTLADTPAG
jgi:apolipoprotein N-acyltransferase